MAGTRRPSCRQFVQGMGVVGLGLVAGCRNPFSQPEPTRAHRIGLLALAVSHSYYEALLQGLRELGYVEGQNLIVERRYAEATDQLHDLAAELVRLQPDVLVPAGSPAISIAQQLTKEIPIVMPLSGDPVRQGYVASLARPGGNTTGLSTIASSAIGGKRLQLIKDAVPGISRVVVLWNPESTGKALELREMEVAARTLGVQLEARGVRSGDDFESALSSTTRQPLDALVVLSDPLTTTYRARIADFALQNGLASISETRVFAETGMLMTYGPDPADLFRRAATYVDKILKGAKPADLPVEQPRQFDFVINLKTARELGLTIPQHVLLQATEVIQ
jgi:putative ABC transport system substrate-binding protein